MRSWTVVAAVLVQGADVVTVADLAVITAISLTLWLIILQATPALLGAL